VRQEYYDFPRSVHLVTFGKIGTQNDSEPAISSHSKAIKNSVTKWAKQSEHGVRSIVGWIRGLNDTNDAALDRIQQLQRDKLLGDGRKKERRRRRNNEADPRQIPINRFSR
jgi:hypothetical protein